MSEATQAAPLIYAKIACILAAVDPIAKSRQAGKEGGDSRFSYKFRGIDDFTAALHPLLAKYQVFVTPHVEGDVKREERQLKSGSTAIHTLVTVRFRFWTEDGSYVDAVTIGEGADSGDKSANKAMSAAFKYALMQVFAVPTEDRGKDSEEDSPEFERRGPPSANGAKPASAAANASAVAKRVAELRPKLDGAKTEAELQDAAAGFKKEPSEVKALLQPIYLENKARLRQHQETAGAA